MAVVKAASWLVVLGGVVAAAVSEGPAWSGILGALAVVGLVAVTAPSRIAGLLTAPLLALAAIAIVWFAAIWAQ